MKTSHISDEVIALGIIKNPFNLEIRFLQQDISQKFMFAIFRSSEHSQKLLFMSGPCADRVVEVLHIIRDIFEEATNIDPEFMYRMLTELRYHHKVSTGKLFPKALLDSTAK